MTTGVHEVVVTSTCRLVKSEVGQLVHVCLFKSSSQTSRTTIDIIMYTNLWPSSLEVSPSVQIGSFLLEFCNTDHFHGNGPKPCLFCCFVLHHQCYIKLLAKLACLSCAGDCWASVIFVWTLLCLVHTDTTSGQHSPVQPSRSVSMRLVLTI